MQGEKGNGEVPGEEAFFGHKTPVDSPLVLELARQIKGACDIGTPVASEEGDAEPYLVVVGLVLHVYTIHKHSSDLAYLCLHQDQSLLVCFTGTESLVEDKDNGR